MRYSTVPSDRIDTTISQVVVQQGADAANNDTVAARHILTKHADLDPQIIAVWREPDAKRVKGQPVYAVEWVPAGEAS